MPKSQAVRMAGPLAPKGRGWGREEGCEETLGARVAGFMSIKAEPGSQIPVHSSGLILHSLPLHKAYIPGPTEPEPLPANGKPRWWQRSGSFLPHPQEKA